MRSSNERSIFRGVTRQLAGIATSVFPYALAADLLLMVLARFVPAVDVWMNWAALHVSVATLALLTLFGRVGIVSTTKTALVHVRQSVGSWTGKATRADWLKAFTSAALVLWGLLGGAGITGTATLVFAIAVVIYRRWSGTVPFVLGMVSLILTAITQAIGWEDAPVILAIYAFELLAIAAMAWVSDSLLHTGDKPA